MNEEKKKRKKNPKNCNVRLRMTQEQRDKLDFCSSKLEKTKTDVMMKGLDMVYYDAVKKNR